MSSLEEYRAEQLKQLAALQARGIDAYPSAVQRDVTLAAVQANFDQFTGQSVWLAGRLLSIRQHGQITFLDLADQKGQLQLIVRSNNLQAEAGQLQYEDLNLLTRGDFVNAYGTLGLSSTSEPSLDVGQLRLLTKVLRPLPAKLEDVETRRRRRYLDLALNPAVRERFARRSQFWQTVRDFLNQNDFLEINTPVLEHTTGGAEARPFKTHMKALDEDFYLRISHELPLKKLLGGGYDKIYDLGPRFRNEHITDEHLPEHIAIEFYQAYADWQVGMAITEKLLTTITQQVFATKQFTYQEQPVDFQSSWAQQTYADIMQQHYQLDVFQADLATVNQLLKHHRLEVAQPASLASGIDKLFKRVREQLAGPLWVVELPVFMSVLAKKDPQRPQVTQRFQGIAFGTEICNGFSELNDPQEQLARLRVQQAQRDQGDDEAQMLDIDFVEMLEYGMPPACGVGFSERLFWLLEGVPAREGVPFNQLRAELDGTTKAIYDDLASS